MAKKQAPEEQPDVAAPDATPVNIHLHFPVSVEEPAYAEDDDDSVDDDKGDPFGVFDGDDDEAYDENDRFCTTVYGEGYMDGYAAGAEFAPPQVEAIPGELVSAKPSASIEAVAITGLVIAGLAAFIALSRKRR